jgi:hypothetical protein
LDILVLYDDSVSMAIKGAYWAPLREAVVSVISTLQSDNIGIGLRWFSSQNCKAEAFMVPDIPVDTLPDNADALTSAVMNHSPASYFGGLSTQMSYAIEGTTQYMRQLAKEHPSRRHIILLVTDGEPGVDVGISACPLELKDSTIDMTVKAAAAAFKRYPSIPIYVLGVGPSLLNLNSIAKAGGTSGAFVIDSDKEAAQPVLESLVKTIRSKDLPCDYAIPVEYTTYNDPTLVNVTYNGRLIGYVGDVNQCHPEKGGWYFDNPAAPERILTCKKTCEDFSDGGDVDIVLGCEVFELI